MIADLVGKPLNYEMLDFHSARPGHDLRYALDGQKMADLGWNMEKNLERSLQGVVDWSLENKEWIEL